MPFQSAPFRSNSMVRLPSFSNVPVAVSHCHPKAFSMVLKPPAVLYGIITPLVFSWKSP